MDDFELLRQYVEQGAHEAFGELVRRHIDLVYSSALRQLRDPHDAQDVCQAVFITLARDARKIKRQQVLVGWLMTATRNLASHARQSRARRRNHERIAGELANTMNAPAQSLEAWERIAPELDEALADIAPGMRDAILLRYFHNQSVGEVARDLGISEAAAKRRLSRGLEQLRDLFRRRGIIVPAVMLATAISAYGVQAAPPGLAAATTASIPITPSLATSAILQKGLGNLMTALKTKAALLAGMTLAVGGAGGAVVHHAMARAPGNVILAADLPAATPGDPSWRKRFDEVYRIEPGQILRRVPPPFIPERAAYFNEIDPGGNMFDATGESMTVFAWTERHAELSLGIRGVPTLATVLGSVIGIPGYSIEAPLKDLLRPVPGDWIMRKEAPPEKKMAELVAILRGELKWNGRFEKREAEHNVFLATGTFTRPHNDPEGMVDVFVDIKNLRGMSGGDVGAMLRSLGERCNTEIIDQTHSTKENAFWRNHTGDNLSAAAADKMLDHVSAQTGLRFERARRVTAHWVAVYDAAPAKQP